MKVTVRDINQPERVITDAYAVDPLFGPPAVGDEIYLRERAYQTNHLLIGTVTRRQWHVVTGEPHETELALLVTVAKKK